MLFKFSSVLYFSKYHDSGRLQAAYPFSCFQGPCCLWRYLFLLLYMWQSTLALPPLSLLRFVWLNFGLPFSGPCSQEFLVFSLSRAKEVSMPLQEFVVQFKTRKNLRLTLKNALVCFQLFKRWPWFWKQFKLYDVVENLFCSCCVRIWR